MDFQNRHPLNAIAGYENLSMLEALIPFVEYPLKLPLALFIKFSEIRLIINCFQSNNNLTRLGLHNPSSSPLDMICSLTGMSPDLIKMMFSMMDGKDNSMFSDLFNGVNTSSTPDGNCDSNHTNPLAGFSAADISNAMNMFQSMQSGAAQTPNNTENKHPPNNKDTSHSTSSDHFEQSIQSILAEYDLSQASEYDKNYTTFASSNDDDTRHIL